MTHHSRWKKLELWVLQIHSFIHSINNYLSHAHYVFGTMFCTGIQWRIKWQDLSPHGVIRPLERKNSKDVYRGELQIQREGKLTIWAGIQRGGSNQRMGKIWAEFITGNCQEFLLSKAGFPVGPLWTPDEPLSGTVLSIFSKAWSSVWWLVPFNLILFNKDPYDSPCHVGVLQQSFLLKPRVHLIVICLKVPSPTTHYVCSLQLSVLIKAFQETPWIPEETELHYFLASFVIFTEYLMDNKHDAGSKGHRD